LIALRLRHMHRSLRSVPEPKMQAPTTHPAISRLLTTKPRVCIVGGGWSGLYALKWFVEEGLTDVVLFEQTNSVGGVWVYTEDKPGTSVASLPQV
jgi:ribulose 1,5-bisphosphate synthetase/thiazole synthase